VKALMGIVSAFREHLSVLSLQLSAIGYQRSGLAAAVAPGLYSPEGNALWPLKSNRESPGTVTGGTNAETVIDSTSIEGFPASGWAAAGETI
jgi:hypothetical protein